MQGSKKEPDISKTSDSGLSYQSLWSSIESCSPDSALPNNSSFKMGVPAHRHQGMKLLDFSLQDQDSSSTQSSGQSYSSTSNIGENNTNTRRDGFTLSDYSIMHGKHEGDGNKFSSAIGAQSYILPSLQADFSQSFPQLAIPFPDQHFSGVISAYAPQALVMGVIPARVPLPLDLSTNEPIYVNAKQYRGILRRRQHRAKLEAQNKLLKNRKPYLHESRHQHALKRARGTGGRFLNTKKTEEAKPVSTAGDVRKHSSSVSLHLGGNIMGSGGTYQQEYREGTSTTSCSDVTSTSTGDDVYHPSEFRFYDYSSRVGGGGGNYLRGNQH